MERIEQGILVYGESVKGRYYAISVDSATSTSENHFDMEVSIKM